MEIQKDGKTERQKTERQKDRKMERQKDRKTERQNDTNNRVINVFFLMQRVIKNMLC